MFLPTRVTPASRQAFDLLQPLRQWLNQLEIGNADIAQLICRVVPAQCPFERNLQFRGRTIMRIPPLCKLNPLYDEVVGLRFRALCYLADVCGKFDEHREQEGC
ncbi:MAG: Mo-dependent nitrogenase C-terminal domain-containing protein [Elainella sp. C42_A2020_010]|nr:Mo-dependent nitrogenase C-terminal domain-containing protein [Elainella sp. C42_A2020_010]RNJ68508.1 MAG: nitrogenase [Leptolyngbya sp. IPPAS B-1204]